MTNTIASPGDSKDKTFSFGENWLGFLDTIDSQALDLAIGDIDEWIGLDNVKGRTIIDIGSGSGLSSLAFVRCGCSALTSIDIDPLSVKATREISKSIPSNQVPWTIMHGSILDDELVRELGLFDIVYSWGVLHHTGAMWDAIRNATRLCREGGLVWITIYTGGSKYGEHLDLKRRYNLGSASQKQEMIQELIDIEKKRRKENGLNPDDWNRKKERGMTIYHDIVDWLGGLPYEVARPSEILVYCGLLGLVPLRVREAPEGGCSGYLFQRAHSHEAVPWHDSTFEYEESMSGFAEQRSIIEQLGFEFRDRDARNREALETLLKRAIRAEEGLITAQGEARSGRAILRNLASWLRFKFGRMVKRGGSGKDRSRN